MNEEEIKHALNELNLRLGSDLDDQMRVNVLVNSYKGKKNALVQCLKVVNNEVPTKISSAIEKAEQNSSQIETLKNKSEALKQKIDKLLNRTEPLRTELAVRLSAINKLEQVLGYLQSFERIEDLSQQMKQTNDEEQLVLLYGELKEMCGIYQNGHQANYLKDYIHYWHNVLKDKLSKNYEDVLKLLKWPFRSADEHSPPPKEILLKFTNLTKYLFLIQEPDCLISTTVPGDYGQEPNISLPVKILLRPLKKRFAFHFTGPRQTARIDRPEWFLTQTLTWIKDHDSFVNNNVQPVADKLELGAVKAVDEFNDGLVALAAERLHIVLATYYSQGSKGEIVDVDAAFAHAVDETLGFNRELFAITGREVNSVLYVLTKAETFVRWLAVEKKYALAKMDETLGNEQWSEAVGGGTSAAVGSLVWVPRCADWFITLLKTIEDRYMVLPQPGHRLQFLELQLELVEEWRVRLTQLLSAATASLHADTFLSAAPAALPFTAVINAAHHTSTVLLQWAHSLHYLQLHFYRRQFQQFTQFHHHDENDSTTSCDKTSDNKYPVFEIEDNSLCLKEVEDSSHKLAMNELSRRQSMVGNDITSQMADLAVSCPRSVDRDTEEGGVFADGPALLARLRDAGLDSLVDHILMEFKAGIKEYKRQKWHALLMVEESALSVSPALCAPLGALCARLGAAAARLAPALASHLRGQLARSVDEHIFEEVVLENWFNTGGVMQITHDVRRNLVPAFAPPYRVTSPINPLPKLLESCKLLNMDYNEAHQLRQTLGKQSEAEDGLIDHSIRNINPSQALQILKHRTDLSDANTPASVMDLF